MSLSLLRLGVTAAAINKGPAVAGPDPHWASVVLLAHCDGANGSTTLVDAKGRHTFAAAGNAALSTATPKFGTAAAAFDGTGDYFETTDANNNDFMFGTGDFTVELFVRRSSATNKSTVLLDYFQSAQTGWEIFYAGNSIQFYVNASNVLGTGAPLPADTWQHIAISRNGSTLRIYTDGVLRGTNNAYTINHTLSRPKLGIGAQINTRDATYDFFGQLDEIRITKGVGRYPAAFTPPAAPFSDS